MSFRDAYRLGDDHIEPTFNLRLIEAVKHSRCLYDSTDRQYRSSEYKNRVWNRLVQVLGFEGDSRTLYARWKQLRDKYGKEKRKAKYNNDQSSWQYYKHLHFLDPHMIDRTQQQSPSRKEGVDMYFKQQQQATTDPNWGVSLIEEVRIHPCLFDIRDPKYRHSDCRNQAWQEVIKNLNFPGDVNAMYKQWKKLRDRYVREKRRIREQTNRGLTEDSTWDLFHHMSWMDPYLDERAQRMERDYFRHVKRKHETDTWSDQEMDEMRGESALGYATVIEKRTGGADVLLDGDSAFAASVVSDLRSLPESSRNMARAQIEHLLENGPGTF